MKEEFLLALKALAEPNWAEKWGLFLSCISIFVSGVAIFYAIRIPKKIAEQQNKIALFEKRLAPIVHQRGVHCPLQLSIWNTYKR